MLEDYGYVAQNESKESVIVTSNELRGAEGGKTVFYVAFKAYHKEQITTFRFNVQKFEQNNQLIVDKNHNYNGVLAPREIITFYILGFDQKSIQQMDLNVYNRNGKVDMILKECRSLFSEDCKITEQTILQAQSNRKPRDGLIFKHTLN